jgi:hypothetical protein
VTTSIRAPRAPSRAQGAPTRRGRTAAMPQVEHPAETSDPRPFCERCHTVASDLIVANGRGGSRYLCSACYRKAAQP